MRRSSGVRYTQVIVNHGREAGASLAHPHAQILGLPFVPTEILDEERAFARFAGGCVICTTIEAEEATGDRVVFADDDVVCVAPFWSGAPYELLLMPRRHEAHLQAADDRSLDAMGRAIRDAVGQLESAIGDVAFNLGVHSAPHEHSGEYHWHVHLWPNLVTQAGFERGTGVMINVVSPEDAADASARCRPTPEVSTSLVRSRRSVRLRRAVLEGRCRTRLSAKRPACWPAAKLGRGARRSTKLGRTESSERSECTSEAERLELPEQGGRRGGEDDDDDERGLLPRRDDGDHKAGGALVDDEVLAVGEPVRDHQGRRATPPGRAPGIARSAPGAVVTRRPPGRGT